MRSLALILVAASLVLSAQSLYANENQSQEPKSSSLPRDRTPQQSTAEEHRKKSEDGHTASPSPSAPISSQIYKSTPQEKDTYSEQKSKGIGEKAFAPETWSQWALFLAAVIAAGIGLKTLKTMNAQVDAATHSAEAAKATADALINSERAWIAVSSVDCEPPRFDSESSKWQRSIKFTLINHGRTVARLRQWVHGVYHTIDKMDELSSKPDYPATIRMSGPEHTTVFLKPNATMETASISLNPPRLTVEQLNDIEEGKLRVVVYVRFTYFDFANQERTTQVCYEWVPLTGEWAVAGPREYNKYT